MSRAFTVIVLTFCGFHIHYRQSAEAFSHSGHSAEKDATDHGLEPRANEHLMPQSGLMCWCGFGTVRYDVPHIQ